MSVSFLLRESRETDTPRNMESSFRPHISQHTAPEQMAQTSEDFHSVKCCLVHTVVAVVVTTLTSCVVRGHRQYFRAVQKGMRYFFK